MTNNQLDRYADLPATWSDSAKETYAAIEEAAGTLTPAQAATLYEAVSMLAIADGLEATLPEMGYYITNARGATALNPAIPEIRALRRDALAALRGMGLKDGTGSAGSSAGAALAGARWGSR